MFPTTPAFDAVKAQGAPAAAAKPATDLDQIMALCANSDYVISIDGGGSKTSLQVIYANDMALVPLKLHDGSTVTEIIGGPTNINVVGFEAAQENLRELMQSLYHAEIGSQRLKLQHIVRASIVCGLAGLVSNADKKPELKKFFVEYGVEEQQIYLAGDVDLAKQLIGEEGAILIAGTGSVCFSKSGGIEKRIGGYGYILGDGGSGFYIGKLALKAALDAKFQNKTFVLTDKLCQLLNVPVIDEAIKLVYNGTIKPADIAKIAPSVFEAAFVQKNPTCQRIIGMAAHKLANHIASAVDGSHAYDFPIYLIGGIFKSDHLLKFIEIIRKDVPYTRGLKFINIAQENIAAQVILKQIPSDVQKLALMV